MNAKDTSNRKGNAFIEVYVKECNEATITNAEVTLRSGDNVTHLELDEATLTYRASGLTEGNYQLRATAKGLKEDERNIYLSEGFNSEIMILGKEGLPYYFRNNVRVPFEPKPDLIAVTIKPDAKDDKHIELQQQLKELGLVEEESCSEAKQDSTLLFRFSTSPSEDKKRSTLRDIEKLPSILHAGPVVGLNEHSLSYMINELIVRYADDVSENKAKTIASEFGFEIIRKLVYSPNTYQMRSVNEPGSYHQLEIADQLMHKKDVLWAEPNLVTTVELDTVTPADYLWPGVWDRQLVDTPNAWQNLQDFGLQALGEPNIIIAAVDQGIESLAGVPKHPEFQGTVSDGSSKVYKLYDFRLLVPNNDNVLGDHGMGVSGVAAASAENASSVPGQKEGLAGAAPNCRIMGLIYPSLETDILDMYMWAAGFNPGSTRPGFPAQISPGADIFTTSIGFGSGAPISAAAAATFDYLTTYGRNGKGCLCFFSAGNARADFTTYRPWAAYAKTWGMAASTIADDGVTETSTPYSGFGPVEICAPSHDQYPILHNPPTRYGTWSCQLVGNGNLVGHATTQTTLSAAANTGDTTITVASVGGFNNGDKLLLESPGASGSEVTQITAPPNVALNQLSVSPLLNNHVAGASVVTGANDYRNNFGGTSSATPLAAGVAALVLSANPKLCWLDVRRVIRNSAVKIDFTNTDPIGQWIDTDGDGVADFSKWYGYGRIDAKQAVTAARSEPTHCYAPLLTPSSGLSCFFQALVFIILIALLIIPAIFFPQIRCTVKQLAYRINHCTSGNDKNCTKL